MLLALFITLFVFAFANEEQTEQPAVVTKPGAAVGSNQEIPQLFKPFVDSSSNFCKQLKLMKFNQTGSQQQQSEEEMNKQQPIEQLRDWINSVC